jgi:hypothetical protein
MEMPLADRKHAFAARRTAGGRHRAGARWNHGRRGVGAARVYSRSGTGGICGGARFRRSEPGPAGDGVGRGFRSRRGSGRRGRNGPSRLVGVNRVYSTIGGEETGAKGGRGEKTNEFRTSNIEHRTRTANIRLQTSNVPPEASRAAASANSAMARSADSMAGAGMRGPLRSSDAHGRIGRN